MYKRLRAAQDEGGEVGGVEALIQERAVMLPVFQFLTTQVILKFLVAKLLYILMSVHLSVGLSGLGGNLFFSASNYD